MDVSVAIKQPDGSWKENSFLYHSAHACSSIKEFFKGMDVRGLGIDNVKPCPHPAVRKS